VCIIPHFGRFLKIAAVVDFTAFQRFQGSTGRTSNKEGPICASALVGRFLIAYQQKYKPQPL
jgi:hypothetical protein